MKSRKINAYPEIFLHDCHFTAEYSDNSLKLIFADGFCIKSDTSMQITPGYIQISDISMNDISIHSLRYVRFLGEIRKELTFAELKKRMSGLSLMVLDEYYSCGRMLYICTPYPYSKNVPFSTIEIAVSNDQRPIEYFY